MSAETTFRESWISGRERALLQHIRAAQVIGHPTMVTVQSRNGKKGFGFPVGDAPITDREAYIEM